MSVLDDLAPEVDVDAALRSFRGARDARRRRRRVVQGSAVAGVAIVLVLGTIGLIARQDHHGVSVRVSGPSSQDTLRLKATSSLTRSQRAHMLRLLQQRMHAVSRDASVAESGNSFLVRFPPTSQTLVTAVTAQGVLQNREDLGSLLVGQSIPTAVSAPGATTNTSTLEAPQSCNELVNDAHAPNASDTGWFWDRCRRAPRTGSAISSARSCCPEPRSRPRRLRMTRVRVAGA